MALTDLAIRHARPLGKAYRLSDCHGLYIQVNPSGSKLWYLKFRFGNKENRMALGPYPLISLAMAREKQADIRRLILEGINPAEKRREEKRGGEPLYTFESVAREWVSSNVNWSAEHKKRVLRYFELYVFPTNGSCDITKMKVKDLLVPIKEVEKAGKLDVASRLQQRTACVMRYAVQNGIINHNPASDLTGAVSTPKVRHHPALDLNLIPDFLERVDDFKGRKLTQLAVKLALLLFIRSSELRLPAGMKLTCITPCGPSPLSVSRSPALSTLRAVRRCDLHTWCLYHIRPSNCSTRCDSTADRELNWCSPAITITANQ